MRCYARRQNPSGGWSLHNVNGKVFMDCDERYRQAVAALHGYMKNRKNPLTGPEYEKVVNEMFDAQDAFAEEQERN